MTNVGNYETSDHLMTPPGTPDRVSVVCFMHDTHHIILRESTIMTNPSVKHLVMPVSPCLINSYIEK